MSKIKDKLANKTTKLTSPGQKNSEHPAKLDNNIEDTLFQIDIPLINPNPDQPRKIFREEALVELTESIKQKGVIQPIIVRKNENDQVFLVAGERRLRAAKRAGLRKIPAIFTKGNPVELALIENLQRENLTPIEEAEAVKRMIDEHGYSQKKLSFVIGKKPSTVSETISLSRLPEEIKKTANEDSKYSRRILVEIARQRTVEDMKKLFNRVSQDDLKSDDIRRLTRKKNESCKRTPAAMAIEKVSLAAKQLDKLNIITIEQNERTMLFEEMRKLRNRIDEILSGNAPT